MKLPIKPKLSDFAKLPKPAAKAALAPAPRKTPAKPMGKAKAKKGC